MRIYRKILPALSLFIALLPCTVAQTKFWTPPRAAGVAAGTYDLNISNIQLASEELADSTTSWFWNKAHQRNLFLAYLQLDAPRDTMYKYFNWAMTRSLDYCCELKFEKGQFDRFLQGKDTVLWQAYNTRCARLFASYDSALIRQLDTIRKDDQELREKLEGNDSKIPKGSAQARKMWQEQSRRDSVNAVKIERIFQRHGYPGNRLVGLQHAAIAFHVVEHGPLALQEQYFYLIKAAAEREDMEQYFPAYLADRIRMQKKKKQIYGTQFVYNARKGQLELYPVQNRAQLNARRIRHGLVPIEVELKRMMIEE